ncbi:MAG: alpha/beta hydrolase [Pseudomonadota bacterium]
MTELQDYSFKAAQTTKVKKIVIFLHGYGADGKDLISIAPLWADYLPDTVFYAPNAPQPCEMAPSGFQWFGLAERSEASMNAGAKAVRPLLAEYLRHKCQSHGLTLKDVALVGFSQGTMVSLDTVPRMEEGCAGILGFSGRLLNAQSLENEVKSKFPICLIHGTADDIVPFDSLAAAKTGLAQAGFDVESHQRPGLGHGIDEPGLKTGLAFLKKILD